jgi:hypothetical protein
MERELRIYLGQTQVHRPLGASPNVLLEVSESTRLRETLTSASEAFRSSARRGAFFGASGVFGYIDDRVREDSSQVLTTPIHSNCSVSAPTGPLYWWHWVRRQGTSHGETSGALS